MFMATVQQASLFPHMGQTVAHHVRVKALIYPDPAQTAGSVDAAEAPHNDEPSESQKQLASFMINGVCPKCKRVVTRGHKKHLHTCSGATQRPQKSLADMIKTEMAEIETDNAKLQELELGGLIEFDDARAVYMVVGSTGAQASLQPGHLTLLWPLFHLHFSFYSML